MIPKLKDADVNLRANGSSTGLFSTVTVGGRKYKGLRISCADTECVFEFVAYKFNPENYSSGKRKRPAPKNSAPLAESDGSSSSSPSTPIGAPLVLSPAAVLQSTLQFQSSTEGEEAAGRSGDCLPLCTTSTHRAHTPRVDGEEDCRALVVSEEDGPISPLDSNKYGGAVETKV